MIRGKVRSFFRQFHLCLALGFGSIFVLSGLSGSIIAWMHELDILLNPGLFQITLPAGMTAEESLSISPARVQQIVDRLNADPAYGRPSQLFLPERADEAAVAWYRAQPAKSEPYTQEIARQVMLDPHTLAITGERNWGEIGISRPLLLPTVYHLHRYLLAGKIGKTAIGVSGLVLLLTSLVGIALWWPTGTTRAWRKAVTISWRGTWPRFHYSFHRAAGIFVAPVLLVLGFSGMAFNLPDWVRPVIGAVASLSPSGKLSNETAKGRSPVPAAQAVEAAQALFPTARVSRIAFPATPAVPYEIRMRQPDELRQGDGNTRITIDAYSGKILRVRDPNHAAGGDAFLSWLFPLHSGEAFGAGGRIFISGIGLTPLVFLVTGIALWLRRKSGSQTHLARK